jgi:carboxypeptidase PM20D1
VEKGFIDVSLTVTGDPGHSSSPPKETTIGILAKAITNLEEKQQPSRFGSSVEYDTMKYVAPYASFGYKLILGNLWLFSSILSSILSKGSTDAIQRTTTAVTIIRGGIKSNVLPSEASAVVNHRIHPADTIETVIAQDVSELRICCYIFFCQALLKVKS